MVFLRQESTGRSGDPSRLRDKLLLFNARTGLSQQGLASFVGVSTAALRNWEAGQSKPTAQNLKRLIELYVAYRTFAGGEEQAEAEDLWEAAQERGLKVPFDEHWFQELLANQPGLHTETERERQHEQQHEHGQEPEQKDAQEVQQEPITGAGDDRSSMENKIALPSQPPVLPTLTTRKLSRRTVVAGLACLVVGGAAGSSLTWIATRPQTRLPSPAKWTQASNMLLARSFFRATLLPDGLILIEGGLLPDKSLILTAQSELFDPSKGTWRKTGGLNTARAKHTATLLSNGMVLVTGGMGPIQSAELFDPKFGRWTKTSSQMNYARAQHTATLLANGKVLIAGGSPHTYTAELYNPDGTWSEAETMMSRRYGHVAVRLFDDTVLVAGGRTVNDNKDTNKDNSSITYSAELYDPQTNKWFPLPNMNIPRADFTAALLPDGRVIVIGGRLPKGEVTPTTEIYDPNTRSKGWQLGASMNYGRTNPLGQEALQLEDGTIMVVGGDTLGTSERYNPANNTWVSMLRLHYSHYLGATVVLNNGQVLVAGGFDVLNSNDKTRITHSTEIYTPASE